MDVRHEGLRIGGEVVGAGRHGHIAVHDPFSRRLVGTVPKATLEEVRRAFDIARGYRARLSRFERSNILNRAADAVRRRTPEIAALISVLAGDVAPDDPRVPVQSCRSRGGATLVRRQFVSASSACARSCCQPPSQIGVPGVPGAAIGKAGPGNGVTRRITAQSASAGPRRAGSKPGPIVKARPRAWARNSPRS